MDKGEIEHNYLGEAYDNAGEQGRIESTSFLQSIEDGARK